LDGKESNSNYFADTRLIEIKDIEQEMIDKRKVLDKILMY
jgi:hypothetical protein